MFRDTENGYPRAESWYGIALLLRTQLCCCAKVAPRQNSSVTLIVTTSFQGFFSCIRPSYQSMSFPSIIDARKDGLGTGIIIHHSSFFFVSDSCVIVSHLRTACQRHNIYKCIEKKCDPFCNNKLLVYLYI